MHFIPASISVKANDGTELLLREVTVADRERAIDAFDRLSADDVAMRFWRDLVVLDKSLLDRLTSPDQINHIAWCALNPKRLEEPGFGAGSVWRSENDPSIGEISITILPESQGRGVGLILFAQLFVLADLLGMKTLRANVLNVNHRALKWFRSLGGEARAHGRFQEIDFSLRAGDFSRSEVARQVELAKWIRLFQLEFAGEV